jgi:hypothetical protein
MDMTEKEVAWTKMFAYDLPAVRPAKIPRDCCEACVMAREIKCVCRCGGANHGSALKKDIKRLDEFTGPNAQAIGDLALDLELSGSPDFLGA